MRHSIKILSVLALCLPALLSLDGCAALGGVNQFLTSQKNPVVLAGVTLAVSAAIGNNPATEKKNALAIKTVASDVLADASTPAASVALLEAALNQSIAAHAKNPGQLAAFMVLSATLEQYLATYIQTNPTGVVTSATLVDIQGVCKAVITATSYYGV